VGKGCFESALCASVCCLPETAAARQCTLCSGRKLCPPHTHYRMNILFDRCMCIRRGLIAFNSANDSLLHRPGQRESAREAPGRHLGGTWEAPGSCLVAPRRALPGPAHSHSDMEKYFTYKTHKPHATLPTNERLSENLRIRAPPAEHDVCTHSQHNQTTSSDSNTVPVGTTDLSHEQETLCNPGISTNITLYYYNCRLSNVTIIHKILLIRGQLARTGISSSEDVV
jgi:hypothetical protein